MRAEPDLSDGGSKSDRKRHVLLRLFGISLWGWVKLVLLCVLVGFFVMVSQYEPEAAEIDVLSTLQRFFNTALIVARWAIANFWQPALAGATLVLPIWILWRVVTLPFRR